MEVHSFTQLLSQLAFIVMKYPWVTFLFSIPSAACCRYLNETCWLYCNYVCYCNTITIMWGRSGVIWGHKPLHTCGALPNLACHIVVHGCVCERESAGPKCSTVSLPPPSLADLLDRESQHFLQRTDDLRCREWRKVHSVIWIVYT